MLLKYEQYIYTGYHHHYHIAWYACFNASYTTVSDPIIISYSCPRMQQLERHSINVKC